MSGFLLDTNCISESTDPQPNPGVAVWLDEVEPSSLYLSVLTIGEIRKGISSLAAGRRRFELEAWLEERLRLSFRGRILPIDEAVVERWGLLEAETRKKGRPIPTVDGLLAATALEHNLTLATRNVKDFVATHVRVLNPWT
jgi:predicted nucleic acid-binding protein